MVFDATFGEQTGVVRCGDVLPAGEDLDVVVLVQVVDVVETEEVLHRTSVGGDGLDLGNVRKVRVLQQAVRNVDSESVDAPVEPEAVDGIELSADCWVAPVQVRLFRQEQVAVVLAAGLVEGPRRRSEVAGPVVGWAAVRSRVPEQVVVTLRRRRIGERLLEPSVFRRGVVRHDVEHHTQAELVGSFDQVVDVLERAVDRVDLAVRRNVVAVVVPGRLVERREPDDVDAKPLQVIETPGNARDVADSVAVAVSERPDIDLVADRAVEPLLSAMLSR